MDDSPAASCHDCAREGIQTTVHHHCALEAVDFAGFSGGVGSAGVKCQGCSSGPELPSEP